MASVSARPSVALASCARLPDLWEDDQVLAAELRRRGVEVRSPAWDDADVDWSAFDLVVIRNTWDYWHRRDDFVAWAHRVAAVAPLLNPAPVVEWNTHKGYLRELAAAGIPVVPTEWVPAGAAAELVALMAERGWADVVVKPAVSAAADRTARLSDVGPTAAQELLDSIVATREAMVQPYVEAIDTSGERSLLFVAGTLTHAVRRPPYLVTGIDAQSTAVDPATDEAALAARVLGAVPGGPARLLYARIDLVRDADGTPMLMEAELTEPQLFFALSEGAVDRMANAIEELAGSGGRSTTTGS